MLEDALGSRSKVRILRELVRRGVELTTEDLVRATGQSTGTLVPSLQQLAASGVVATRVAGRQRLFQLHARHPATPILRRAFAEEAAAIHALADGAVRRAQAPGLRFAAWYHDVEPEDERRHAPWLLAIADEPAPAEAALRRVLGASDPLRLRVLGVADARAAIAAGDATLQRALERGRVVWADRAWLDGSA